MKTFQSKLKFYPVPEVPIGWYKASGKEIRRTGDKYWDKLGGNWLPVNLIGFKVTTYQTVIKQINPLIIAPKVTIEIPKGYHRLHPKELRQYGDFWFNRNNFTWDIISFGNEKIGACFVIRKNLD